MVWKGNKKPTNLNIKIMGNLGRLEGFFPLEELGQSRNAPLYIRWPNSLLKLCLHNLEITQNSF